MSTKNRPRGVRVLWSLISLISQPGGRPECGLGPPGPLQLLLRVSEASEAVVGLVPLDGPVEGRSSLGPAAGLVCARPQAAHVLHRQAAGLQDVRHRAQDILCLQGETHRPEP